MKYIAFLQWERQRYHNPDAWYFVMILCRKIFDQDLIVCVGDLPEQSPLSQRLLPLPPRVKNRHNRSHSLFWDEETHFTKGMHFNLVVLLLDFLLAHAVFTPFTIPFRHQTFSDSWLSLPSTQTPPTHHSRVNIVLYFYLILSYRRVDASRAQTIPLNLHAGSLSRRLRRAKPAVQRNLPRKNPLATNLMIIVESSQNPIKPSNRTSQKNNRNCSAITNKAPPERANFAKNWTGDRKETPTTLVDRPQQTDTMDGTKPATMAHKLEEDTAANWTQGNTTTNRKGKPPRGLSWLRLQISCERERKKFTRVHFGEKIARSALCL